MINVVGIVGVVGVVGVGVVGVSVGIDVSVGVCVFVVFDDDDRSKISKVRK